MTFATFSTTLSDNFQKNDFLKIIKCRTSSEPTVFCRVYFCIKNYHFIDLRAHRTSHNGDCPISSRCICFISMSWSLCIGQRFWRQKLVTSRGHDTSLFISITLFYRLAIFCGIFSYSDWMWRIVCIILLAPQNNVMDLDNVVDTLWRC